MMSLKIAGIFCLLCAVSSCKVLSRGQVTATQKFAHATTGITKVPADIYYRIYLLRADAQTLQLNTVLSTNDDVKESVTFIEKDYQEKIAFLSLAEQYSAAYAIVEEYAHLVESLLDPNYQNTFARSKIIWLAGFQKMLVRYNAVSVKKIPPSMSVFTANLASEIGKLSFGKLQKKYLKQALQTAYEPFLLICDDFLKLDSSKIQGELNVLPQYLANNYANFLENMRAYEKNGNNPYQYYATYTPIYSRWLGQLNDLKLISEKTAICFRQLKVSYTALLSFIESNNKKTEVVEIEKLLRDYSDLLNVYDFIDKRRDKLNSVNPLK